MKEKKIISLKKRRNELNFKKLLYILRIPLVIAVVAVALFLSARLIGNVALSNATDAVRQVKNVFSDGKGFPYSLENINTLKIDAIGKRLLILSDDESLVLDGKAGELFSLQLGTADSKVISHNGRALIYCNGSNEVILQSKTEKLGEIEEGGNVITAALSKNGSFATSHQEEGAQSVLTVYNNRFEKEFIWNCANERITAVSLTPDGKKVAVSAMGVENAEIYSRILIFNIKETKPVCDARFSGTLFLELNFTSKNVLIASGDNKTVVLVGNGEKKDELIYSENSIMFVESDSNGNVAVCCSEYGGSKSVITVFKKNGARAGSVTVHGEPEGLDIGSGKLAVICGNEIVTYNFKGEEKKRVQTELTAQQVIICFGEIFTVENGKICKY